MRLRRVLTLQEVSSAACCSGNSWDGSALAVSTGLGVLFLDIENLSFLLRWSRFLLGLTSSNWWGPNLFQGYSVTPLFSKT